MPRSESSSLSTIWAGSLPLHIAGSARTLTRSLRQRCRRLTSSTGASRCKSIVGHPLLGLRRPARPPLANFTEEVLRRYKKRILLQNPADDDHRMRPHDVDHGVPAKFREIVCADDSIVVSAPHIVHTRLELNKITNMRPALSRPFHVANDATERKSPLGIAAGQLLENLQHPVLIETAVTKIRFSVGPKLELPTLLGGRRINPYSSQTSQMIMMLRRIYDVNCLVATFEAVLYERKQHAILFVVAVKKRADMTYFAELGASKGNWRSSLHGRFSLYGPRETGTPSA